MLATPFVLYFSVSEVINGTPTLFVLFSLWSSAKCCLKDKVRCMVFHTMFDFDGCYPISADSLYFLMAIFFYILRILMGLQVSIAIMVFNPILIVMIIYDYTYACFCLN